MTPMEFNPDKLSEFKSHQKTQFLYTQFETTEEKLKEAEGLAEDPEMAELAAGEIAELNESLKLQYEEMDRIVEASREEEAKPYGVTLEVRAGAGGDEAALLRKKGFFRQEVETNLKQIRQMQEEHMVEIKR